MHRSAFPPLILFIAACSSAPPPSQAGPETPPWQANATVPAGNVAPVLLEEWGSAENRDRCAPLTFAPVGQRWDEARPRAAHFAGGWAIAYDLPGMAGVEPSGRPCARCGRSAFGLAGTGVEVGTDTFRDWPNTRQWADGSWGGWGPEAGSGPKFLAYVRVAGEPCLYNVWSHVSEDHLEGLLGSLRRVDVEP